MSAPPGFIEVNEITDIMSFLKSIDWQEPWLFVVIFFHIAISIVAFLSRTRVNFQIVLFIGLLLIVYFSEFLNEIAAKNWHLFSKQQYFDSGGLFMSIFFSMPILFICIFILCSWLTQSVQLMAKLKTAQLKQRIRTQKDESTKSESVHAKSE